MEIKPATLCIARGCAQFVLTLQYIHYNKYFLFRDDYYRQCSGTAMGSKVVPTYANIFMAVFRMNLCTPSYFNMSDIGICTILRYIDNVFVIWEGTMEKVCMFHEVLNGFDSDIQFTLTCSGHDL